jgi:hypothetical protein
MEKEVLRKASQEIIADVLPDLKDREPKTIRAAFIAKCAGGRRSPPETFCGAKGEWRNALAIASQTDPTIHSRSSSERLKS